jgi:hypothetical protein
METSQGWQPIETAPTDGRAVLVANEVGVGEAQYFEGEGGWWWANTAPTDYVDGQVERPTHWMPLPDPPRSSSPDPTRPVPPKG